MTGLATRAVLALGLGLALPQPGWAQAQGPGRAGPAADGQGFGGADSAAGAADTLGQTATPPTLPPGTFDLGNGLSLLATYTGQAAANPVGGIRQGTAYAGQLFLGIDGDLQRLAGIAGGAFHVAVTNRHGRSLANDAIGNNTSVQEIYGGGQTTRLTLLSYQQKLFDDRLDIEVGRLVANIAFLNSPIYCNFQSNSACGNPTFVFKTSNFTFWPVSSWGGHAKAWLTDTIFVHAGAYEVNPRHQQPGDNGVDFSLKGATGAIVPFELGYSTTAANDALPRNYGIGGWYDASDYADPVRDATGRASVLTGQPAATRFGRSGVYARFDQMVWRPDPNGIQGLTLFGVAMAGTSGRLVEDYFLEVGALQTGTFAGRPFDTVGFVVNTQAFSPLALSNIALAQSTLGLVRRIPTQQVMMELNYGLQIDPAIRLTPNLQYIVNPDQTRFPFYRKNIPDALVVGAKLSIDLFSLAGLARGPGSL